METNRNYSTISPSARMLLMMKGLTDIPFAAKAALLALYTENKSLDDILAWGRVMHFESRYKSIDQLLNELGIKNILELSSGYSFRGLDMVQKKDVHYIDTDLDDVVNMKKLFEPLLTNGEKQKGKLELLSLNALDTNSFDKILERFPEGQIAIVNEGLLMYLGIEEKQKLCAQIHKALKQRGGYWITADIYVRFSIPVNRSASTTEEEKFFEQHHIDDNMFDSFEAAEAFFRENGFVIEKRADNNYSQLVSTKHFLDIITEEQAQKLSSTPRIQETWMLRAV